MKIGLHDAEKEHFKHKTFPNLALMKISAYHKGKGDDVEWWNPLYRYDRVYSSKVFDFTPIDPYLPDDAIRGGTGYRDIPIDRTLPDEVDGMFPDYSIYPKCDYAVGYLTWMSESLSVVCGSTQRRKHQTLQGMAGDCQR